jgi:hypothetical protein
MKEESHIYLFIKNIISRHGTITHYYHFFFAVLIPIILVYIEYIKIYNKVTIIINNDMGPMLRILLELPIDIKLKLFIKNNDYKKLNIKEIFLKPLDIHPILFKTIKDYNKVLNNKLLDELYTNPEIVKIKNSKPSIIKTIDYLKKGWAEFFDYEKYKLINNFFKDKIEKYDLIVNPFPKYDIVLIERKTDVKYSSLSHPANYADITLNQLIKIAGSDRRSIVNHKELFASLKKYFKNNSIINISTEYLPIFDQYTLFNNSKIVIAQHGAVLSNIIFMKSKSLIIEIIPKSKIVEEEDWFIPLTETCKIQHLQYIVEEAHSTIDIKDFKKFMNKNDVLNYL